MLLVSKLTLESIHKSTSLESYYEYLNNILNISLNIFAPCNRNAFVYKQIQIEFNWQWHRQVRVSFSHTTQSQVADGLSWADFKEVTEDQGPFHPLMLLTIVKGLLFHGYKVDTNLSALNWLSMKKEKKHRTERTIVFLSWSYTSPKAPFDCSGFELIVQHQVT